MIPPSTDPDIWLCGCVDVLMSEYEREETNDNLAEMARSAPFPQLGQRWSRLTD